MTEADPKSKKSRLLHRALLEFSDACDIPELTPSCPFYQLLPDGSPVCAEECKDILEGELLSSEQHDVLSLGGEFAARPKRRLRSRRQHVDHQVAFDARQIYLTERARDVSAWSMTSLINGLKIQYAWMAIEDGDAPDYQFASRIATELSSRGVPPDLVIRQGLYRHITSSIVWHLRNSLRRGFDELGWINLAREVTPDFSEDVGGEDSALERVVFFVNPYLTRWILFAPLDDLVNHRFDGTADDNKRLGDTLPERDHDVVWLVDRFTSTYLKQWRRRSLQREWRYMHSQNDGCCPAGYMHERSIDLSALAGVLAEIGASQIEHKDQEPGGNSTGRLIRIEQFFPLAVKALGAGDRAEAASIFRMIAKVRPDDREVMNNLGFCILPEEPAEAEALFTSALEDPSSELPIAMTYANLAIARFLSGDRAGALESLELARTHCAEEDRTFYMWDIASVRSGNWTMVEIDSDLREYIGELTECIEAA